MRDPGGQRMSRSRFVAAWLVLALLKLALVASLPLFGDEAFYWWEGEHLAWSYSDLPPLTAWMIAAGSALLPGELGVRLLFLVLSCLLPWQVVWLSRRWHGPGPWQWWAGLLALVMPLSALLGILGVPDVALAGITVLAVVALADALAEGGRRQWLWLGACLALGLLCHYRFAVVLAALAWVVLATSAGRAALASPGPWLAGLVAAAGLLPLMWFNWTHQFSGLRFQFVDRHPWAWQWQGLWQLPEQLLVASPLLLILLARATARHLASGRPDAAGGRPADIGQVVVPMAVAIWLLFIGLGFFADGERFRWHWPLPAYLLLLPLLARELVGRHRRWRQATVASAALVSLLLAGWLVAALVPERAGPWAQGKRYPANFAGWRESARWLGRQALPKVIVVDNFMLAANLAFYLPESRGRLWVLDDARNVRHGRATQLAIWGVDESALAARPAQPGWLVVEETARRFSDRWAWYQELCRRFAGLELAGELSLHGGRKRFVRWHHQGYRPRKECTQPAALPPLGWFEAGARAGAGGGPLRRGDPLAVTGWAVQPGLGIDQVQVAINGVPVATGARGLESGWAPEHWGETGDPAGTRLGFRFDLETADLAPGRHRIQVKVVRGDGRSWPLPETTIHLRP